MGSRSSKGALAKRRRSMGRGRDKPGGPWCCCRGSPASGAPQHRALIPLRRRRRRRSKPSSDQVILDYDYTFTTPYFGSDVVALNSDIMQTNLDGCSSLCWEDTDDHIDFVALSAKEPILFYDEAILYEDELADNGISFLTVRGVRLMPTGWFLLLRFWVFQESMTR